MQTQSTLFRQLLMKWLIHDKSHIQWYSTQYIIVVYIHLILFYELKVNWHVYVSVTTTWKTFNDACNRLITANASFRA